MNGVNSIDPHDTASSAGPRLSSHVETSERASLGRVARRAARVGWMGALLGAVLAVAGQVVVAVTDTPGAWRPDADHRVAGVVVVASIAGALLGVIALVGQLVQGRRMGRATVTVAAIATGLFVWVHAFSTALRVGMGSPMTLSGLQYFLNSGTGIAREFAHRTWGWLLLLVLVSAALGLLFSRGVRWAGRARPSGAFAAAELGLSGLVVIAWIAYVALPLPRAFALGVRQSTPEIAFAASFETPPSAVTSVPPETAQLAKRSLVSPPIEAGAAWTSSASGVGVRPNIVLITVEATNIHHLGYEGSKRGATPNLDRLASESLVAHHAYTTATHSNYAQPAILSSLFPRRGSDLDMYESLAYPRFLLHDAAKALGYTTSVISSQDEDWQGMRRFQLTGNIDFYHHSPDFRGEHLDIGTEDVVPDGLTAKAVLEWIDGTRAGGKPFEVYVNMQATHFPYSVPPNDPHPFTPYEPKGTYNYVHYDRSELETVENRYDNALHSIDTAVGILMDGLAARGLADDTIFVFVADHGELFWEHDMVTHGRTLFESEAVVPLIVRYPRRIHPGHVDIPVSTLDILPTITDAMGIPPHPSWQGQSLLPFEHDARTAPSNDPAHAGIFMNIQGWKHLDGMVCYPFKLVYDPETETRALYDIQADPEEASDLATLRPQIADALANTLHAQIAAQLAYHHKDEKGVAALPKAAYAPRLLDCPKLDAP